MAERKIGDLTYRCHPIPAKDSLELLADLTRVVTTAADKLQDIVLAMAAKEKGVAGAEDAVRVLLIEGFGQVLQVNTGASLTDLLERVLNTVESKRPSGAWEKVSISDDFTGNLGSIVPVTSFALETQYADFFGASAVNGALASLRAAFEMMKSGK